jgi:DNA-binding response OmpR family regulator
MEPKLALVVEDDPGVGGVYVEALKQAGFTTELFTNGRAAMARLTVAVPDIILLDLNLPIVSGENVLHAIRSDERLKDTRIIITTGESHRAKELESQADLVLVKPISATQLSDLAARMVVPGTGPFSKNAPGTPA